MPRDERFVVDHGFVDVVVATQRVEAVRLVVVQRRLFADAGEHRVRGHIEVDAVRVVIQRLRGLDSEHRTES